MSFIHDIPDFEDQFIGYAILGLMGYFLFIWLTGPSSPLPAFALKSQVALLVAHLELLMVAVIPLALMGLIQSLNPSTNVSNRATTTVNRITYRVEAFRKSRSQTYRKNKTLNKPENLNETKGS